MPEFPRPFVRPLTGPPPCKAGHARIFSSKLPWEKRAGHCRTNTDSVRALRDQGVIGQGVGRRKRIRAKPVSQIPDQRVWRAGDLVCKHEVAFWPLSPDMDKSGFLPVERPLWIHTCKKLASQDMKRGFATAIVARAETASNKIIGYYTLLSAASVLLDNVSAEMARKMPRYPNIPLFVLADWQLHQVCKASMSEVSWFWMPCVALCANELCVGLVSGGCQNERIAAFYEKFLFQRFSDNALHLWMHRKQGKSTLYRRR